MNILQIYIAVSVVVLAVIAILVFFVKRKKQGTTLTPLASLAFGFVVAGILFGDNGFIGYSLMGVGVLLAILDMVKRSKTV